MNYEVRGVREDDLSYLAGNLRAADVKELYATYGNFNFKRALTRSANLSDECFVGVGDGNPCFIFGYKRVSKEGAAIWAAGTSEITNYRKPFLRLSRLILAAWFHKDEDLRYLFNFTHSENTLHHRWLTWCGATLMPDVTYGARGEKFKPFIIRRSACVI